MPGSPDAERGQHTYYKYMVHGDHSHPKSWTYAEILRKRSSLLGLLGVGSTTTTTAEPADNMSEGSQAGSVPRHRYWPARASDSQSSAAAAVPDTNAPWHCTACTFTNHEALQRCEICEMPRSSTTAGVAASSQFDSQAVRPLAEPVQAGHKRKRRKAHRGTQPSVLDMWTRGQKD